MSFVKWIWIGLIVVGILCIGGSDRFSLPLLLQAGLALIGLGLIVGGGEAMVTRHFVMSRRGFADENYRGWGAVLNGIIWLWIGVALIGFALVLWAGAEQSFVDATIRRPGVALINLSFLLLAVSGITFLGSVESQLGPKANWFVKLFSALLRSIPALILLLLALAFLALGLLEVVSPATFDELGGGFLEVLFLGGAS